MKKSTIIFATALFSLTLSSFIVLTNAVGKQFPAISGETLDRKTVDLPVAAKGTPTLIGMAYSKKAEADLKTWLSPAYNKFIAKTGLIDQMVDTKLYFIPMFTGAANLTADIAIKQLSDGTDKKYYPYLVCYRGKLDKYKDELNMTDKTKPYFFVIDKDGKIVYQTSGEYTEKKMEEIEDKLTD